MNDAVAPAVETVDVDALRAVETTVPTALAAADESDALNIDFGRWLINLFIVFHVSAVVIWVLPANSLQVPLANAVRGYLTLTGCWQSWSMFSPNPVNQDTYLGAVIHYKDGSRRNYTFPRIAKLGIINKYRSERWRKFLENTVPGTAYAAWPYLARYAAIENNPDPKTNPPISVDLIKYQRMIAPNNEEPLRYVPSKMMTEHVIAMPSKGPLHLGSEE